MICQWDVVLVTSMKNFIIPLNNLLWPFCRSSERWALTMYVYFIGKDDMSWLKNDKQNVPFLGSKWWKRLRAESSDDSQQIL